MKRSFGVSLSECGSSSISTVKALRGSLLLLICVSGGAHAQQPGTPAYNSVFLPGHGAGDTHRRARDNWGAVAFGRGVPIAPVSGMNSRKEAEAKALELCVERGGQKCKVHHSFKNNCMVFAESETHVGSSTRDPTIYSDEYRRKEALDQCGAGCRIIWEGCARY